MKYLLPVLTCLVLTVSARSESERLYLGAYTKAPNTGQGIYTTTLESKTGVLGPVVLAVAAENPSWVALSAHGKYAYAALEGKDGAVAAYAVQPDGSLQLLNTQPAGGKGTCYVSETPSGKFVLAANYSSGDISVFPVKDDGSLEPASAFQKFSGSGPDASRQKEPHAHFIETDPTGRFVYVCDLGTDKIWIYSLDSAKGTLVPAEPAFASVPPGAGPRHLAFHPKKPWVYATNEMGLTVSAFLRDEKTGALTPLQEPLSTLTPGSPHAANVTTAEILCHPSGKWLYVSNRGTNTIAIYAIGEKGELTFLQEAPALVQMPRGMAVDPTGHWLLTAGQNNSRLAVLKINPRTGLLSATERSAEVPSPVSVVFAP